MAVRAAAKADRAAEHEERRADRDALSSGKGDFMSMYLLMQRDREDREERRAAQDQKAKSVFPPAE